MVTLLEQVSRDGSEELALSQSPIDQARLNVLGAASQQALPTALSTAAFKELTARELALANRLGLTLSLVMFQQHVGAQGDFNRLSRVIRNLLQSTEVLGTTADGQFAVLFRCSDDLRAKAFVSALKRELTADEFDALLPFACSYCGERREWATDLIAVSSFSHESQHACGRLPDAVLTLSSSLVQDPPIPKWKRWLDVGIALICLLLLSPLFLLVGLFIKVVSRGPIFFRQERIGYLGRPFRIWKFRTMVCATQAHAHQQYVAQLTQNGNPLQKMDFRSQLIPLGRWMRVLCIDELPQLFNVLAGSMSLVGPRPDVVPLDIYKPWQLRRFLAVPGMTGLWQVCGKNRTTFEEMVHLDIAYSQSMSPVLDARILLMTLPVIVQQVWDGSLQ